MSNLYHKSISFYLQGKYIEFNKNTVESKNKLFFTEKSSKSFRFKTSLLKKEEEYNILNLEFKLDWEKLSDCISYTFSQAPINYDYIYKYNECDGSFLEIFVRGSSGQKQRRIQFDISPENIEAIAKTGLPLTLCMIPEHLTPAGHNHDTPPVSGRNHASTSSWTQNPSVSLERRGA